MNTGASYIHNIGAQISAYTIWGLAYNIIYPKPYSNYSGPYSTGFYTGTLVNGSIRVSTGFTSLGCKVLGFRFRACAFAFAKVVVTVVAYAWYADPCGSDALCAQALLHAASYDVPFGGSPLSTSPRVVSL